MCVPLSFIKYLVVQIKYQIHYNWVGFEGITRSGATHNFQNSGAALEYLPLLPNMKSSHIEGTDLIIFKLSCSYTLPQKLCKCLDVSDELLIKENSVMGIGVCLVIYFWVKLLTKNKSNYLFFREIPSLLQAVSKVFFCLEWIKWMRIFFCATTKETIFEIHES